MLVIVMSIPTEGPSLSVLRPPSAVVEATFGCCVPMRVLGACCSRCSQCSELSRPWENVHNTETSDHAPSKSSKGLSCTSI